MELKTRVAYNDNSKITAVHFLSELKVSQDFENSSEIIFYLAKRKSFDHSLEPSRRDASVEGP